LDVADDDPQTKLFYVTAREQCDILQRRPHLMKQGTRTMDRPIFPMMRRKRFGVPSGPSIPHGKLKWEWKHAPTVAGVLSTAGLVFRETRKKLHCAERLQESAVAL